MQLPAEYCQKNKERLQKEACERYQNLSEEKSAKKKKQKSVSIIVKTIKTFLKMKNKG